MTTHKGLNQRVSSLIRTLLWPLSSFYGALTDTRNWLYTAGFRKSESVEVPTLSVGNLTVGGTGKTPHVEYLIRVLGKKVVLATLSRGYGRQTRGFRLATVTDTAQTLGDEPLQLYHKFGSSVIVAVGEKRVNALRKLREQHPAVQLVLLDDAFQHRALRPDLNVLLTDYNRPFYEDDPFPGGRLRERRPGAGRADAIVVSKCPADLPEDERQSVIRNIKRYARPEVPIFFSTLTYASPHVLSPSGSFSEPVLLVSGLANADPFEAYARQQFQVVGHRRFADHHAYTASDWQRVRETARQTGAQTILTTEKDAVKLRSLLGPHETADCPVFYLPVAVSFLFSGVDDFDGWILEQIDRLMTLRSRHSAPDA